VRRSAREQAIPTHGERPRPAHSYCYRMNNYDGSQPVDVGEYLTADGKNPYREWLETLDVTPRVPIQARVLRFSIGNLVDHKSVAAAFGRRG